jgi:phosphohistidine phosphatase
MKQLILIRHAKSSWEAPLRDKDRPLTKKGILDAHRVSSKLVNELSKTFIVWCSPSERAQQTALIFSQNVSFPLDSIILKEELYTFDSNQLEKSVKSISNDYDCVILFGHNGAITDFVNKFGSIFIENVPTSGVVILNFDTKSWEDIKKGTTQKILFPKHLIA